MTRRLPLLAVLFGLVLSFTTGITPAGADSGDSTPDTYSPTYHLVGQGSGPGTELNDPVWGECKVRAQNAYPSDTVNGGRYWAIYGTCKHHQVDDTSATRVGIRWTAARSGGSSVTFVAQFFNGQTRPNHAACTNIPYSVTPDPQDPTTIRFVGCNDFGGAILALGGPTSRLQSPVAEVGFLYEATPTDTTTHVLGNRWPITVTYLGNNALTSDPPPIDSYLGYCTGQSTTANCTAGQRGPAALPSSEASAFAPRLACGRTLTDVGNGQWFANAKRVVRNPGQGSDSAGYWKASWEPGVEYPGANATIPLPPDASTSKSYYVTHFMERTVALPVGWTLPERTGSTETVNYEVQGGILIPGVSWLFGWKDDAVEAGVNNGAVGSGTVSFDIEDDGYGDPWPVPSLAMAVAKIRATCTIRVSPLAAAVDNDPDVIVIDIENNDNDVTINPPTPEDPYGGPTGGSEGGGSGSGDNGTCGGGSLWNPVTWAKSLWCRMTDVAGAVKDLLVGEAALGFIGGLAAGWLAKFPLSVISEVVDAFGQTRTALEAGMDSSCGPTFTPDLSGLDLWGRDPGDAFRVALPSPNASCPQSEWSHQAADLGGFRVPLRGFFTVLLWGAFLVRVAHSIGPGRSDISPEG